MFLQVMVLWEVACLRIKSGSYFLWNVAELGGELLWFKTWTPGRILFGASRCWTFITFCNFLMWGKLSASQKKKKTKSTSNWVNEHTVRTPVFCINLCLTTGHLQNRCWIGRLGFFFGFGFFRAQLCFSWGFGLEWSGVEWSVVPGSWWCSLRFNLITKLLTLAVLARTSVCRLLSRGRRCFLPGKKKSGQRRPALCNECVAQDGFVEGKVKFERVMM